MPFSSLLVRNFVSSSSLIGPSGAPDVPAVFSEAAVPTARAAPEVAAAENASAVPAAAKAAAARLGLSHTHFSNPHGLDSDGHYTTARELAAIAAAALENETFAEIAGTYKKVISTEDGSISRLLVNHNRMLRSYDGAIGVKTGYTSGAGRCLVSAARRDGVTLIAVTLDDHRDWADHTAMLDAGFAAYSERILCGAGELTYTLPLEGAEENSLTVSNGDSAAVVLPRGAELRQVVELPRFVFAPVRSGQTLGAVHYYVGEREVASVPLFAQQSAEEKQSGISGFFASLGSRISALGPADLYIACGKCIAQLAEHKPRDPQAPCRPHLQIRHRSRKRCDCRQRTLPCGAARDRRRHRLCRHIRITKQNTLTRMP